MRRQAIQPTMAQKVVRQQGAEEHHCGESAGGVDQVQDDLRQPLVLHVEIAGGFLAGINGLAHVRGPTEGIGDGELVILDDVSAGAQVKPGVGITRRGGEHGEERQCGEGQNDRAQPCGCRLREGRRDRGGAAGGLRTHSGNLSLTGALFEVRGMRFNAEARRAQRKRGENILGMGQFTRGGAGAGRGGRW